MRLETVVRAGVASALLCLGGGSALGDDSDEPPAAFRPPAIPLVVHDPYLSVWSFTDRLTDSWSVHWTGKTQAICGLLWIDGEAFRFAGLRPEAVPAMEQVSVAVHPTRTEYQFRAGGVDLDLMFLNPLVADDPDLLSRPITHVTLRASAAD